MFVRKAALQLGGRRCWLHTSKNLYFPRRTKPLTDFGRYQQLQPGSQYTNKPDPHEPDLISVPQHIKRPTYARTGSPGAWDTHIPVLTEKDVHQMRSVCQISRDALELGCQMVKDGVCTADIDQAMHQYIIDHSAYPSCLNYMGFPKSVCISVNNVIAHGIPNYERPLVNGDIVNIDVTAYSKGLHGDTSRTVLVGGKEKVDERGQALVETTKECLEQAIGVCGPGVDLAEIGDAICDVAEPYGYSVSEELTGHGVGANFHQQPLIYHHRNREPGRMQPGMCFTIEPILCQGQADSVMWPDGWTVVTRDGGRSAQFEHTVLITDHGVEVFTSKAFS